MNKRMEAVTTAIAVILLLMTSMLDPLWTLMGCVACFILFLLIFRQKITRQTFVGIIAAFAIAALCAFAIRTFRA